MPTPFGTPNFPNRALYQMDNLDMLRGVNSGTIGLIATDPPFNKGRDFHATPESLAAGAKFDDRWRWEVDVQQQWVDQIADDWPATHRLINAVKDQESGMAAFMAFLGVRLIECKRALKETGSIYVHLDPTASHYIKALMDTIFGRENFRNEIIWAYTTPANTKRWFPRKHDTILYYVKTQRAEFNIDAVRVPYKRGSKLDGKGCDTGVTYTNDEVAKGKVVMDWWSDITPVQRLVKELTGYPTQSRWRCHPALAAASPCAAPNRRLGYGHYALADAARTHGRGRGRADVPNADRLQAPRRHALDAPRDAGDDHRGVRSSLLGLLLRLA